MGKNNNIETENNIIDYKIENEEVSEKYKELEKLYFDTQSYLNDIVMNPAILGKRAILKAFIKCFLPSPLCKLGRRILNFVKKIFHLNNDNETNYEIWIKNNRFKYHLNEELEKNPFISILVPLFNTDEKMLKEMIESCLKQTYKNFELCLADASDLQHDYVSEIVKKYQEKDSRIKFVRLKENLGISENTNVCRELAKGEYLALLDHDDLLLPHALYSIANIINEKDYDVFYSDEDHSYKGKRCRPFFKPDFNRDLMYSQMYICHLLCFKADLFDKIGGLRDKFNGSQDYDLMLRLSEVTEKIYHIKDILYTWRETEDSTSINPNSKPYAHNAGKMALEEHLKRRYGKDVYVLDGKYTFIFDPRYPIPKKQPMVSVIIPTKDHYELLKNCINSILKKTDYDNYEVIILDNNSKEKETFEYFEKIKNNEHIKVIKAEFEFNWSKLNNFGIHKSNGDVFIFLNNDTQIISRDWMRRLVENSLRNDIGVVGPLLLYKDNTIQHAGVVIGMNGWADHVFKGMTQIHEASPFVSPMASRNVSAVTGACMAISRKVIEKIGEFDEEFIVCGSDVEICIRAIQKGYRVLYDANVKLYHLESKSRDVRNVPKIDFVKSREVYKPYIENGDPNYNPNLNINSTIPRIKTI